MCVCVCVCVCVWAAPCLLTVTYFLWSPLTQNDKNTAIPPPLPPSVGPSIHRFLTFSSSTFPSPHHSLHLLLTSTFLPFLSSRTAPSFPPSGVLLYPSASIHHSFFAFLIAVLFFLHPLFPSFLPTTFLSPFSFPSLLFSVPVFFHLTSFFSFLPLLSFTHSILLSSLFLLLLLSLLPVPAEEMLMCQPPGLPELRLYNGGREEREREGWKKRDSGDGKRTVESVFRHKWFRLRSLELEYYEKGMEGKMVERCDACGWMRWIS